MFLWRDQTIQYLTQAVLGCRCIDALVTMGVLVPGGDRTAVRRTAEFFLKNFEVSYHLTSRLPACIHPQTHAQYTYSTLLKPYIYVVC